MAIILFKCPFCGKKVETSEDNVGREGLCPGCEKIFEIPEPPGKKEAPRAARPTLGIGFLAGGPPEYQELGALIGVAIVALGLAAISASAFLPWVPPFSDSAAAVSAERRLHPVRLSRVPYLPGALRRHAQEPGAGRAQRRRLGHVRPDLGRHHLARAGQGDERGHRKARLRGRPLPGHLRLPGGHSGRRLLLLSGARRHRDGQLWLLPRLHAGDRPDRGPRAGGPPPQAGLAAPPARRPSRPSEKPHRSPPARDSRRASEPPAPEPSAQ